MSDSKQFSRNSGFTLVELSIVLVIIGLIIGGVLVGQEMIKAAEMRNFTSRIDQTNAAINVFRGKVGYLPGDVPTARGTSLGITPAPVATANGNGILEGDTGTGDGERQLFWSQLAGQNLVPVGPNGTGAGVADVGATSAYPLIGAVAAQGTGIGILSDTTGRNHYFMGVTTSTTADFTFGNAFTPAKAAEIDFKLDNGEPSTGAVRVYSSVADAIASTDPTYGTAASDCAATATTYNGAATTANCALRIAIP